MSTKSLEYKSQFSPVFFLRAALLKVPYRGNNNASRRGEEVRCAGFLREGIFFVVFVAPEWVWTSKECQKRDKPN